MKRSIFSVLVIFFVLFCTGCEKAYYSFQKSNDEIELVEIVDAENSLEFTVLKTLSDTDKIEFLKQFQNIQFDKYYFGDPMTVNGTAIKITYLNGDYEIICYYWAEYVKDGKIYPIRKNCNQQAFENLIDSYLN